MQLPCVVLPSVKCTELGFAPAFGKVSKLPFPKRSKRLQLRSQLCE